jgi:hypothetical protein
VTEAHASILALDQIITDHLERQRRHPERKRRKFKPLRLADVPTPSVPAAQTSKPTRSQRPRKKAGICERCAAPFLAVTNRRRFCSERCRNAAWTQDLDWKRAVGEAPPWRGVGSVPYVAGKVGLVKRVRP